MSDDQQKPIIYQPNETKLKVSPTQEKKFPLPMSFLTAWLISLAATAGAIVIFSLLGAEQNALLGQVELFVVIIALSLVGILTQSKGKSLMALPDALLIYFPFYLIPGFFYPFGIIGNLLKSGGIINQVADIIAKSNPGMFQYDSIFALAGIVVDVVIILLIIPAAAIILTAFFKGLPLGIGGIIKKVIIIVFLLIIVVTIPLAYIGVAKMAEGSAYMIAGATYAMDSAGLGVDSNAMANFMENETAVSELSWALAGASQYFEKAAYSFDFVEQNWLAVYLLQQFPDYSDVLDLFSAIDGITKFCKGSPGVFLGLYNLFNGVNGTFNALPAYVPPSSPAQPGNYKIGSISAQYEENFRLGLLKLRRAIDNFTASQGMISGALGDLQKATKVKILQNIQGFDIQSINDMMDGIDTSLPTLLSLGNTLIDFVNGTYLCMLSLQSVGENNLLQARSWMQQATLEFEQVNANLNINTAAVWQPIRDATQVFTDMTTVLKHFIKGGLASVQSFIALNASLVAMDALNVALPPGSNDTANNNLWDAVGDGITDGNDYYDNSTLELDAASTNATAFQNKANANQYGDFSSVFAPTLGMIGELVQTYKDNMTEIDYLLTGLNNTYYSYLHFSSGAAEFHRVANLHAAPYTVNEFQLATNNFTFARTEAQTAYTAVDSCGVIAPAAKTEWKSILFNPGNTSSTDTLYGCSDFMLFTISEITSASTPEAIAAVDLIISKMNDMDLFAIFNT